MRVKNGRLACVAGSESGLGNGSATGWWDREEIQTDDAAPQVNGSTVATAEEETLKYQQQWDEWIRLIEEGQLNVESDGDMALDAKHKVCFNKHPGNYGAPPATKNNSH